MDEGIIYLPIRKYVKTFTIFDHPMPTSFGLACYRVGAGLKLTRKIDTYFNELADFH